jgi:hypothetical protein
MDVSFISETVRNVREQQSQFMRPSRSPRYPSPGPMMSSFRGASGLVSGSVRVMLDLPWNADVVAARERSQALELLGSVDSVALDEAASSHVQELGTQR